jgi:N-acetyl-anhydromuramyl-L-alanine amidase AmpD
MHTIPSARRDASRIAIDRTQMALPPAQYFNQKPLKDLIVLHFTAGQSARSAFDAWRADSTRVATAFIVDVDGTIYETFPPAKWAHHLGVKGGTAQDKRSIGVELANVGPLKVSLTDPQILNWWPSGFGKAWCRLEETARYVKATYRGADFFASFPEAQTRAAAQLVHRLCDEFSIPRALPPKSKRMEHDAAFFSSFQGVAAHHNFRSDKWDTGPAFDWNWLEF